MTTLKRDGVALLITDPSPTSSTTILKKKCKKIANYIFFKCQKNLKK